MWDTRPAALDHAADVAVPGLDVARYATPGSRDFTDLTRAGRNRWALMLGRAHPELAAAMLPPGRACVTAGGGADDVTRELERVVLQRDGVASVLVACLELDRCGLWISLVSAGYPLPIVIRRAGWVDVRGQAAFPLGVVPSAPGALDRVGLGPGDALVLVGSEVAETLDERGERFAEDALLAALLSRADAPAGDVVAAVVEQLARFRGDAPHGDPAVLAFRVPPEAGLNPDAWLTAALGAPAELPGYPVGEPHWGIRHRPSPPRHARLRIDGLPADVRTARQFVVGVLRSWRMPELCDELELIASELTTNAIRHGSGQISVLLTYDGRRVRFAAGDGSRLLPVRRPAHQLALGGRGLELVDGLAADWGVAQTVHGKRVWAEVVAPPPSP